MPKAAPISASFIASSISSRKSETTPLHPAMLFSAICLLVLVVAFVLGEPGVWL